MTTMSITPPNPTPEMTFYCWGIPKPSSKFGSSIADYIFTTAHAHFKNIVPTTYEASAVYLDEELLKPERQRDYHREMCLITVVAIPNNRKVAFKSYITKSLIGLSEGAMIFYPTLDLPPDSFGTPENPKRSRLIDTVTSEPAKATILLTYFSRRREQGDTDMPDDIPSIQPDILAVE